MYLIGLISCVSGREIALHNDVKGSWNLEKTKDNYTGDWLKSESAIVFTFGDSGEFIRTGTNTGRCLGSFLKIDSIYEINHSCNEAVLR